ncbi:uncharacterized protein LOC134283880 [Saccostrea cucullata]|uniref:uncharacterized protein LOC134283880 n=1 Tax=Saccostrea cuccullata TaxID=36930 RepID=UPI002ED0A8B9
MAHASFTSEDDQLRDKCFLSHFAEILSKVNNDGNKVFIDALSLMEFTCLKLHHDEIAGGLYSECHYVGSVGEGISGLDIFSNNSDIDIMFVMKSVHVVERRPIKTNKKCEQLLKMIDADTTPGYVKLKILENEIDENNAMKEDEFLPNSIVQKTFQAYGNASNAGLLSRMVELLGDKMTINWFVNGPSCSTNLETGNRNILTNRLVWIESVDCVIGLKCNEWPEIADEWIERNREYNWPSGDLIEKAVSLGCYVVPIGGRQSITQDLEWRISFVLAERLLVRNMKYMQLFVYSLLKSIRKEIFGEFSIIISSYIIKTVVFWVMEENDAPSWKPEHVLNYVQICFQKLLEFLEDDFCPNYFMRKCNLFHLKYSDNEKIR